MSVWLYKVVARSWRAFISGAVANGTWSATGDDDGDGAVAADMDILHAHPHDKTNLIQHHNQSKRDGCAYQNGAQCLGLMYVGTDERALHGI